ncbi:Proline iminopeptidase 1 [Pleurostoma richardsiae]|uniref:Proline iminopeptidase 1 n=1 Tax=Pleurostoma richardsiae TaxID=41990 RepID=A0AA38RLS0_9PEZI|nr:Proline iminopeptidase 1 [Pleurostoma richardsiae]
MSAHIPSDIHPKRIPAAKLLSRSSQLLPGQLLVTEYFFEVPLDYADASVGTIQLFGRSVTKHEVPIIPIPESELYHVSQKPWFVYLEGGPGFGNREPQESPLTRFVLGRGYQLLFLDYRGTGLSTPITADGLELKGSPSKQADYLKLFRQDTNVRDLEAVREYLTDGYPPEKRQWSIFGQSFGGFVALSYLSFRPEGLREVFMTGGLAPVGKTAEEVYRATYRKVIERNKAYYNKYPQDVSLVRHLARYIYNSKEEITMPAGGRLSVRRLLTLGHMFGMHGGLDTIHSTLLRMKADLDQVGFFTRPTLSQIEQFLPFDIAPIYAILHEAIYCYAPGVASKWAAHRVGQEIHEFSWLSDEPPSGADGEDLFHQVLYFSGEMIYPFMFDTYPELRRMKEAAELLAAYERWPALYDEARLAANEVPVYAASFAEDMFVDFGLARETASKVANTKVFETNALYHNAVRARTDEVLLQLFRLRDDCID